MKLHLMIIDGQNDFCDPNGSLYVTGADEDTKRLALMIERLLPKLDDIHCTLDSHRKVDISHPMWWRDENGKSPSPFTLITPQDVESGKWQTRQFSAGKRTLQYLSMLATTGRYPHVIWPEHCLIGDQGHNLHPALSAAIHEWEQRRYAMADFVTKGSNPWTEHFSAVRAEVPDPNDPSTQLNTQLVGILESADIVAWSGQALSHCLANTFRDTVAAFSSPDVVKKMVLLTDATSNVQGFEKLGDDFIRDMRALGMQTSTTVDFLR